LRQQLQQPDQLVDKGVVIVEIEGPDAQVANLAGEWPGGQNVLQWRVQPFADLRLAGTGRRRSTLLITSPEVWRKYELLGAAYRLSRWITSLLERGARARLKGGGGLAGSQQSPW
jgi:hypothetical protein